MAFKHQSNCYRTINGEKWVNLCDVLGPEDKAEIVRRKALGQKIAMRKHAEGYHQAFIHPNDLEK